jgi:hypothetical protein
VLARCTELRTLQVVLCLIALYDVFGDLEGWDDGIRSMLTTLAAASRPGAGRWREAGAPSCACL